MYIHMRMFDSVSVLFFKLFINNEAVEGIRLFEEMINAEVGRGSVITHIRSVVQGAAKVWHYEVSYSCGCRVCLAEIPSTNAHNTERVTGPNRRTLRNIGSTWEYLEGNKVHLVIGRRLVNWIMVYKLSPKTYKQRNIIYILNVNGT